MAAPPVGIDLGTTYSCVAVYRNGKVEVIPNEYGNRVTPSYVAFTDSERLVGDAAKIQDAINPENTIFDVKRLIGRHFNDPVVQADRQLWPFTVIDKKDIPKIQVWFKRKLESFYPEEISAMVLSTLKSSAEAYLGNSVCNAVITVPAYFNDSQRQATKDAGTIAGLNVLRIINEPTAAALSYRCDEIEGELSVLIFDLGGGTFDVSILTIEEGIFEVRATAGHTHLGGEDFDSRLVEHCASEFARKHGLDLHSNNKALRRLRTACERAKRTLSTATQASVDLDALHEGKTLHVVITRACFEELIEDLVQKMQLILQQVLHNANMTKENIEEVVLIGGSARIPYVEQVVTGFFGKKPSKTINMDEAVAQGAAIYAANLNKDCSETVPDVVLVDVTPHSLGVEVLEEDMHVIIEQNATIPIKNTKTYYSTCENQTEFTIKVFEGEDPKTTNNNKLGEFTLSGVPPMRKGKAKIDITFYIDADGIVHVSAVETTSKNENRIKITNNKGRLSQNEILRLIQKAELMKHNDKTRRQVVEARDELELLCQRELREGQALIKYCQNMLAWLANDGATTQIEDIITKRREFQRFIDNKTRNTNSDL